MEQCPQCGAQTRPEDNFCLFCGGPLGGQLAPAAEAGQSNGQLPNRPPATDANGPAAAVAANEIWADSASNHAHAASAALLNAERAPDQSPSPTAHAFLVLATLPGQPRVSLDKPETYIGRLQRSDIVLPNDKLVSRRHAVIQLENGIFTLFDLGSSNGTFVNGRELFAPTPLHHGDHISIGEHELIFQLVEQSETVELPPQPHAPEEVAGEAPANVRADTSLASDALSSPWRTTGHEAVSPPGEAEQPIAEPAPPAIVPAQPAIPATTRTFASSTADLSSAFDEARALLPAMDALRQQSQALSQALDAMAQALHAHDDAISRTAYLQEGVTQAAAQLLAALVPIEEYHQSEDYTRLTDLVQRLSAQPRDIELLAELARQMAALAQFMAIHEQLRQAAEVCRRHLTSLLS